MKRASVSETKNNLSAILRQVREGESYLIVDSSKIGKLQRAFFAPMSAFKAIITEHGETPIGEA